MNVIIFTVSGILILCLGLVLIFLILKYQKRRKVEIIRDLKELYQPDRLKYQKSELDLLFMQTKTNSNLRSDYSRMKSATDRITKISESITPKLFKLENSFDLKYRTFKKQAKSIKDLIIGFDKSINEAIKFSRSITEQSQFIRKEFVYNQEIVRKLEKKYKEKRILLENYSYQIDKEIKTLAEIAKTISDYQASGDNKNSIQKLNIYREKVTRLYNVLDLFPILIIHINKKIPATLERTDKSYRLKKEKMASGMKTIGYSKTIKSIKELYDSAKYEMTELNAIEAAEKVKTIYKRIKLIIKLLNYESSSRNMFLALIKPTQKQISLVQKNFRALITTYYKIKEKKQISKDSKIHNLIHDLIAEWKSLMDKVSSNNEFFSNKNFSYSSKLLKLRIFVKELKDIVNKMNEINKLLWDLNANRIRSINKLNQAKNALNQVISEIKEHMLVLSEESKINILSIEKEILTMIDKIRKETSFSDFLSIDKLAEKASNVYTIAAREVIIAEMARNMIDVIAPRIAIDPILSRKYNTIKNAYDTGDYSTSLNTIISYMEGEY